MFSQILHFERFEYTVQISLHVCDVQEKFYRPKPPPDRVAGILIYHRIRLANVWLVIGLR